MKLRVCYIGNFLHPFCTEVHVTRDAERIPGVEVVRVQEPQKATRGFLKVIEAAARDADLLIYQRTWGLHLDATDLWRRLEERGCKTASYHLDKYVGLDRERTIDNDAFWTTGTVFSADGDPHTQEVLEAKGINHRWLPPAVVSDECVPGHHVDGLPDIAFVGSVMRSYHREHPWRGELLDALARRYGAKFHCYPVDGQRLHGSKLNDLYASVPVIVGDSLCLPGTRDYFTDRYWETVGRGGYLIGPNVPGIEAFFVSGEHLDLYDLGDLDHVYELIDQALADVASTREIARQGQTHVRANHTYVHRIRSLLQSLGLE